MATAVQWAGAARPRTLPAAISPVIAGTGAAVALQGADPVRALLALVVALVLQVGVNYANDYSDGIRGTDDQRVGPFRLTGSGAARPGQVKLAAFAAFGVAAVAGLALVALSGTWWLAGVGATAIAAAW
ncbi:MAG TPA: 1,4-dihydroxy-2-naphthoate octaprenyltransferase, partial [Kineosporiaceae bacterium]|nr:1,4-dihydroxy-2-naphthoate octaprenyltransferase [Kineosporiaceae bacterium]